MKWCIYVYIFDHYWKSDAAQSDGYQSRHACQLSVTFGHFSKCLCWNHVIMQNLFLSFYPSWLQRKSSKPEQ